MNRSISFLLIAVGLMWLAPLVVTAQGIVSPAIQKSEPVHKQPIPKKALTLHPMDQPDPLLRYRLWPAPEKRFKENPVPFVSRALLLELQLPKDVRMEFVENYNDWSETKVADLPTPAVRRVLERYEAVFNELKRAENLMQLDYNLQLDKLSAPEIIETLLPEFQEMRDLGRLLSLRARLAMAEERWDDMVDDCRIGFRLAEIAGHSTDFLIGRLVGFAISGQMMGVIEEAIQQPGCPNLYWALANLPENRLFETRNALEFESVLMARVFDGVGQLPDYPIGEVASREKLRAIAREASQLLSSGGDRTETSTNADLLSGIYVVTLADPSRELLSETKAWGERAKSLSASEAVLRASQLRHARIRDRWVAWSMLPAETWDQYEAERAAAFGSGQSRLDVLESLIHNLMPAVNAARNAGRRTHQHRNFLLTVEAIRMHAAAEGSLPMTLDNMRPVPAWRDAIAVKPFGYQRSSSASATLTRAPRWGVDPETIVHIELKGTK